MTSSFYHDDVIMTQTLPETIRNQTLIIALILHAIISKYTCLL